MKIELINTLERLICPKGVPQLDYLKEPLHRDGLLCITDGSIVVLVDADEAQPGWASLDHASYSDRREEAFLKVGHAVSLYSSQKGDPVTLPSLSVHPAWRDPYAVVEIKCTYCKGTGFITSEYDRTYTFACDECKGTSKVDSLAIDGVATYSTRIGSWKFGDRYLWILSQFAEQVESEITLFGLGDHAMIGVKFDGGHALLISMIEFNKAVG